MPNSNIPQWVKNTFNDKLQRGAYQSTSGSCEHLFIAEREECGRGFCTIQVWKGTIDKDVYDATYNGEPDPQKQLPDLTWEDLTITQL